MIVCLTNRFTLIGIDVLLKNRAKSHIFGNAKIGEKNMNVNLKSLIGRLNDTCRDALEGAAGLCLSRTNYDVEIEHILAKLLEVDDSDFKKLMAHFEINPDRMTKDVETAMNRL